MGGDRRGRQGWTWIGEVLPVEGGVVGGCMCSEGDVFLEVHIGANELPVRDRVIEQPARTMGIEPNMHVGVREWLQFALASMLVDEDMCDTPPHSEAMCSGLD